MPCIQGIVALEPESVTLTLKLAGRGKRFMDLPQHVQNMKFHEREQKFTLMLSFQNKLIDFGVRRGWIMDLSQNDRAP